MKRVVSFLAGAVPFVAVFMLDDSGRVIIKWFEFFRHYSAAVSFDQRRHFEFFFWFFELASADIVKFILKNLLTMLEYLFIHLVILLSSFSFEGRNIDFEDCMSG